MHTFTEKLGIVNQTISLYAGHGQQGGTGGEKFRRHGACRPVARGAGAVNTLAPVQKKMEVSHIKATSDLQTASYAAYNDASGVIDAMAGLLGKGTPAAKKLEDIRSKVRKHGSANSPTPTPPAPTTVAPAK